MQQEAKGWPMEYLSLNLAGDMNIRECFTQVEEKINFLALAVQILQHDVGALQTQLHHINERLEEE